MDSMQGAIPKETAAKISAIVTELMGGWVNLGPVKLAVQFPISLNFEKTNTGIRVIPGKQVDVDRPGLNVWLEYIEAESTGRVSARVNRFGFAFDKEI